LHSRISFEAYCKDSRGEILDEKEKEAIEFCDKNSLLYVRPAIFDYPKPYPGFNGFQLCPCDGLHTVIGGHMKYFVKTASLIVKMIGEKSKLKKFEGNLANFDLMIENFPTGQALGLDLKKFPDGVSPYAGSSGGTKSTQGTFVQ
jgi:hypothetical protein